MSSRFKTRHHPNTTRRGQERGATVAEYGMVLALFVLAIAGVAETLFRNAGDLLNDTGSDIAADPPTRDVVIDLQVTPPSGFPSGTLPPTLLTFVDKPVALADGSCLALSGTALATVTCGDANQALVTGLSPDGLALTLEVAVDQCLIGNGAAVPATVTLGSCSSPDAVWEEDTKTGTTVVYRHSTSTQCLTLAAAPDVLTLAPCDGRPEQNLNVQY